MEINYTDFYSHSLNRNMPCKIYGHAGKPVLFIPCQDGKFVDFENFHMTDIFAPWIEDGKCIVFSIDTVDAESWSDKGAPHHQRIEIHENWINYITREFVPFMRQYVNEKNGWDGYPGIMSFGCSMGATHALNLYLRFPSLFDRCMALSGIYNASYFFGEYNDELIYRNSPADYMANFPADHPFVEEYNKHKAVVCTGLGAWEEPASTRFLDQRFHELGINIWVDYWGNDVNHDWPWWYKQAEYFLPYLLSD
ncbi:MAG: esterase family protein [Firmicutes bacterium]|nr:esterase family protein [Bacillota bacterium]MBR6025427.1 esterase family protein [Bacillota bacterium]